MCTFPHLLVLSFLSIPFSFFVFFSVPLFSFFLSLSFFLSSLSLSLSLFLSVSLPLRPSLCVYIYICSCLVSVSVCLWFYLTPTHLFLFNDVVINQRREEFWQCVDVTAHAFPEAFTEPVIAP